MMSHTNTSVLDGSVSVATEGGITTIEFSHPKGNSLPGALLRRLAAAVDDGGREPESRVIVLRSGGSGAFCGGASFDELRAIRDVAGGTDFFMGFARLILAMRRCPKLVLARVQGKAVGGGVGVAAAADYAIAVPQAAVRLSELAIGIGPFVVGPAVERKIGPSAFQSLSIDAASWRDAGWAERHGLYAQVVEPAALDGAVRALAERLAGSSPEAMAALKRVFWEGTDHWEALLPERAGVSGRLILGEFAQRAIGGT